MIYFIIYVLVTGTNPINILNLPIVKNKISIIVFYCEKIPIAVDLLNSNKCLVMTSVFNTSDLIYKECINHTYNNSNTWNSVSSVHLNSKVDK